MPACLSLFKSSIKRVSSSCRPISIPGGAIIAGTDSDLLHYARDTYSYMWPRDGALTAYTLDRAGYQGISQTIF